MHVNPINLAQPAEKIAAEFGKVPANHEVRAKMQNGVMVLYTRPRPTGARRIMQDLFADRAQKRSNAYQEIANGLQSESKAIRDAALAHARGPKSNAEDYKKVFETLSKEKWKDLPEEKQKASWGTLPEKLQKDLWKELPEALQRKLWKVSPPKLQKELWKEVWLGLSPQEQKESWNEVPKEVQEELWEDLPQQFQKELQKNLPEDLPNNLSAFLKADLGPSVVASLLDAAKARNLVDNLEFVFKLNGMKDMMLDDAREFAANVMANSSSLGHQKYNVPADTIKKMAKSLGGEKLVTAVVASNSKAQGFSSFSDEVDEVDEQSLKNWHKKTSQKSVNDLVDIFKPFLNELVRDLNNSLYADWLAKA